MDEASKRITEWESLYTKVKDKTTFAYLSLLNSMRNDYELIGDEENCKKICFEIETSVVNGVKTNTKTEMNMIPDILLASYDSRARFGDYRAFCIAMEWYRPKEKQFFLPRRRILEKHGLNQALQDIADGKLDFLFVSMPPRTGKSTSGLFFLAMMCGLYPDWSILGNGHSTALTQSFYTEMLNLMTSPEYRFREIFNGLNIVNKSAEYSWIDLKSDKRFHTIMFKSVDGGTTGLAEASNILYCDDLVKDIETANNPDRLDKLFYTYTSTIQDRKVAALRKDGKYRTCPEIHIATRWSLNDPIGRLIRIYDGENNDRVRIINIPCYDDTGESNFEYDYGRGFDKQYYHQLELSEDPATFAAKYLGEPIERRGHPFAKENLSFYTELPEGEPDNIVCCADPSFGGKDYFSAPIGYVYGYEVYIDDVYYKNNVDTDISRRELLDKIMKNKATRLGIEKNNGGLEYSDLLGMDCREKNYRLNITTHAATSRQSKHDRIMACRSEIQGIAVTPTTYRFYFKSNSIRKNNNMYNLFMKDIYNWSEALGGIQKTQKDDCVDSLASLLTNVLSGGKVGRASSKFSADRFGI